MSGLVEGISSPRTLARKLSLLSVQMSVLGAEHPGTVQSTPCPCSSHCGALTALSPEMASSSIWINMEQKQMGVESKMFDGRAGRALRNSQDKWKLHYPWITHLERRSVADDSDVSNLASRLIKLLRKVGLVNELMQDDILHTEQKRAQAALSYVAS